MEPWILRKIKSVSINRLIVWGIILSGVGIFSLFEIHDTLGLVIGIAAFGILSIIVHRLLRYISEPSAHPVAKKISQWGDLRKISAIIEEEVRNYRFKGGGWVITMNFAVRTGFLSFDVYRLDELLWGYMVKTVHRVNGIPTSTTYSLDLIFGKKTVKIPGHESVLEEILLFLSERVPWALFGFDEKLLKLYRSQYDEFRRIVNLRKSKIL